MTLKWPWPILRQGQIWKLRLFFRKKWKQCFFQKLLKPTNWLHEGMWVLKVKVITWPWPKFVYNSASTVDFSGTIEACDLKVGRYRHLLKLWRYVSIEGQCHSITIYFSRFCMFCALLGQDIRWAFTGPLVLWFLWFYCCQRVYKVN